MKKNPEMPPSVPLVSGKRLAFMLVQLGILILAIQLGCGGRNQVATTTNRPPTASQVLFNNSGKPFNHPINIDLAALSEASDPDGDPFIFRLVRSVSSPDMGTLDVVGTHSYFIPGRDIEGQATFELVVVDSKGATSKTFTLTIDMIDTKPPITREPIFDTTSQTRECVSVNITSPEIEAVDAPQGWTRSGHSGQWTFVKVYTVNISEDPFVLVDRAGNSTTRNITVSNIDKQGPEVEDAEYSTTNPTNQDVVTIFRTFENLDAPNGWTKGFNETAHKYLFSKTYHTNESGVISFHDYLGNRTDKSVAITWIDKRPPNIITLEASNITETNIHFRVLADETSKGYFLLTQASQATDLSPTEVVQKANARADILSILPGRPSDFLLQGLNNKTAYVLFFVAQDSLGNVSEIKQWHGTTLGTKDHPGTLAPPTFTSISTTSLQVINGLSDPDGIRQISYFLYSNSYGTQVVGSNSTGIFTGLSSNSSYWARTTAQFFDSYTGVWHLATSPLAPVSTPREVPLAPVLWLDPSTDSGISDLDRYTRLDPLLRWGNVANATGYEVSKDGGPFGLTGGTLAALFTGLADGSHTLAVRCFNDAGAGPAATLNVTLDRNPTAPPEPKSLGVRAAVRPLWNWLKVPEAVAYLVSLDGAEDLFTSGVSFTPASDLQDGSHQISVKSFDQAGNVSVASPAATVTIQHQLPEGWLQVIHRDNPPISLRAFITRTATETQIKFVNCGDIRIWFSFTVDGIQNKNEILTNPRVMISPGRTSSITIQRAGNATGITPCWVRVGESDFGDFIDLKPSRS